jgi:hypothetical protein
MRVGRLLLMVLTLWAAGPGDAVAETRIERMERIAQTVWHHPCPAGLDVRFTQPYPNSDMRGSVAWAVGGEACRIDFRRSAASLEWYELCHAGIHELGHIVGVDHSDNPNSVMYWATNFTVYGTTRGRILSVRGADRRCYDRGRRYLGMPAAGLGWR